MHITPCNFDDFCDFSNFELTMGRSHYYNGKYSMKIHAFEYPTYNDTFQHMHVQICAFVWHPHLGTSCIYCILMILDTFFNRVISILVFGVCIRDLLLWQIIGRKPLRFHLTPIKLSTWYYFLTAFQLIFSWGGYIQPWTKLFFTWFVQK